MNKFLKWGRILGRLMVTSDAARHSGLASYTLCVCPRAAAALRFGNPACRSNQGAVQTRYARPRIRHMQVMDIPAVVSVQADAFHHRVLPGWLGKLAEARFRVRALVCQVT